MNLKTALQFGLFLPHVAAWSTATDVLKTPTLIASTNGGSEMGPKVTVLGGTGFLGSRVVERLVDAGASVTSISKSGTAPKWCAGESWKNKVNWVAQDLTRGPCEALEESLGSPDSLVSCVGAVGFDVQGLLLGNGVANVAAAKAAGKIASSSTYVFCSVASEVAACEERWLPSYFSGYFKGKRMAEDAFTEAAKSTPKACNVVFVKPSFIYGGDGFGLFPPRVNSGYGSAVEELLSVPLTVSIANLLPGLLKVALRPPVSVESVAGAICNAALQTEANGDGVKVSEIDGTAAINAASGTPPATGMTDFVASVSGKFKELSTASE